jgi:hypothetical protein
VTTYVELPLLDEEGQLVSILEDILNVRERRLRSRVIRGWRYFLVDDLIWEGDPNLQHPDFQFLGDKQSREGRIIMSPSK